MQQRISLRRGALLCAAVFAFFTLLARSSASPGDLTSREQSLQRGIRSDTDELSRYSGRLAALRARLGGLEASLAIQRSLSARTQADLTAARARLLALQRQLARYRQVLAAQLVAQYESPSPDLVGVVLESGGFTDLLERVDQMKRVARSNATVVARVAHTRALVAAQTVRLTDARAREQRVMAAVLVEHAQVESLRLLLEERQRGTAVDRGRKQTELQQIQRQLAVLQARAAAAQRASFATPAVTAGAAAGGDGGQYGFFPAPGTNYSVGDEPAIAARLNALGQALRLHLVGLSGYRTPQHSVEVGGFTNDPHTRGEASDTPGVEGVAEATLMRFGLTRPFPGPAEADHIQLAG